MAKISYQHLVGKYVGAFTMGLKGTGKTTFADMICELDPTIKKVSFATPLKEDYARKMGIKVSELNDRNTKEKYRYDIQRHSEAILAQDPYYYANLLFSGIKEGDRVVCDDLRTFYELQVVLESGGIPYQMYSDPYVRASRGIVFNKETDGHFTETELGNLSWETLHKLGGGRIWNNKDLEFLRKQAVEVVDKHFNSFDELRKMLATGDYV